jgi:uncharacterized protein YkwD
MLEDRRKWFFQKKGENFWTYKIPNVRTGRRTDEGLEIIEDALKELKENVDKLKKMPPYEWVETLGRSAQQHAQYSTQQGHDSPHPKTGTNTRPEDRIHEAMGKAGETGKFGSAENIMYGDGVAEKIVLELFLDDGFTDDHGQRGHRKTLLHPYKYLGASSKEWSHGGENINPHIVVINYAQDLDEHRDKGIDNILKERIRSTGAFLTGDGATPVVFSTEEPRKSYSPLAVSESKEDTNSSAYPWWSVYHGSEPKCAKGMSMDDLSSEGYPLKEVTVKHVESYEPFIGGKCFRTVYMKQQLNKNLRQYIDKDSVKCHRPEKQPNEFIDKEFADQLFREFEEDLKVMTGLHWNELQRWTTKKNKRPA